MHRLEEKYGNTALITGGSSGMGEAIAFELASKGITPILVARNKEKLAVTAKKIASKHKINAITYSVDLSDIEAIKVFLQEISNTDIGLFINCAGIENNGSFTEIETDKEIQLINLNITSTYLLTKHFADKMAKNKKGGILLFSSLFGLMGSPYFANYAASKAYVHNLAISLYPELKELGVDISVFAPGLTDTEMTKTADVDWSKIPMSTMQPDNAAKIALYNLGKKATIIPGFMNKMMVFMAKRIFSMKSFSLMNSKMIRKAIPNSKLRKI
ncbi:SDR family NAD(P)-dependent oxidoreductase [Cellulophaga sp. HaHaR_3_176]|uniref:SDR family NAD(P)-dependent oxidoreductase n=1 Tax=Cellulophaga sp. HaHaR_3_176 TaxID=1942464 RepID=UPI001C1FD35D|nr:SDR family NAD(P)-dependent oxidoreductase [Cellulophaga sp. HaHaR_3_176]QWX83028.1 SDR family NAD(P)-dependent oxidoreductase [Cellulophaga sp. HaHaR_3_176]